MKCWGCHCSQSFGRCGGGDPTEWCEEYPGGGCDGGSVGDLNLMENFNALSRADFQALMEASTTKFWGKWSPKGLVLEEVGILKEAGLQKGDILTGIDELQRQQYASFKDSSHYILKWMFESADLTITFLRNGAALVGEMKNPKG
jgi:hypothetical protein